MPEDKSGTDSSLVTTAWSLIRAFFDLVLDFTFKRFVTPRLIRIIYSLSLLAALLAALGWMFGDVVGVMNRLFRVVTGPLAFFVYLLIARVATELVLAVFKIAENVEKLHDRPDKT